MYDVHTLGCFTAARPSDHHDSAVTSIRCTSDGKITATASKDGTVKLWDSVNNRVMNTVGGRERG